VSIYRIDDTTGALTPTHTVGARTSSNNLAIAPATAPVALVRSFAYVVNGGSEDTTTFRVDPDTGTLTQVGSAVPAGSGPEGIAIAVGGLFPFVYVANRTSDSVSAFVVDPATGVLNPRDGALVGDGPGALAVESSGRLLFVANANSDDVTTLSIQQSTGSIAAFGPDTATGNAPVAVAADPAGRFLFVLNAGELSAFEIIALTGELGPAGSVPSAAQPAAIAVDPTGRFVYVANGASDDVTAFRIDRDVDVLTQVGAPVLAGDFPSAVAVEPTGRFAYVANTTSDDVTAFRIDPSTGALTVLGAAVPAGNGPTALAVDPSGRFLHVTNRSSDDVTTFAIRVNGSLTPIESVDAGDGPVRIAVLGVFE
jgi:6-phosphogluconolactonase